MFWGGGGNTYEDGGIIRLVFCASLHRSDIFKAYLRSLREGGSNIALCKMSREDMGNLANDAIPSHKSTLPEREGGGGGVMPLGKGLPDKFGRPSLPCMQLGKGSGQRAGLGAVGGVVSGMLGRAGALSAFIRARSPLPLLRRGCRYCSFRSYAPYLMLRKGMESSKKCTGCKEGTWSRSMLFITQQ